MSSRDRWEEVLFNAYLARLLAHEKMDPKAIRFGKGEPGPLRAGPNKAINTLPAAPTGMMAIERKERRGASLPMDLHAQRHAARLA